MMIVKNETETLPSLFASVIPLVSSWLIIDTGSTDGTQDLIQESLSELPGQLLEREWVNFGHNRTELISLMPAECDFALLLDADQVVHFETPETVFDELLANQSDSMFMIPVRERNYEYSMPYLVRRGPSYRYQGATHEFLTAGQDFTRVPFQAAWIDHVGNGGSKSDKFERDKKLLEADILAGQDSSRNHFYLAQTHECLNDMDQAIAHYAVAFQKSGWDEERYMSALRSGRLLKSRGNIDAAQEQFFLANEQCPDRSEALFEIIKILETKKLFNLAHVLLKAPRYGSKDRVMFIETWIDKWGLKVESGVVAWNVGHRDEARQIFNEVLEIPDLPPSAVELVNKNLSFC
jgi:tetratricopeptide (TPR) repeat protein